MYTRNWQTNPLSLFVYLCIKPNEKMELTDNLWPQHVLHFPRFYENYKEFHISKKDTIRLIHTPECQEDYLLDTHLVIRQKV